MRVTLARRAAATIPRSVSDATRFTSTTPHAHSKAASTPAAAAGSRFARPQGAGGGSRPGQDGQSGTETPEQRVARLRAAHQAARSREGHSAIDKLITHSRSFFDSAHKITVLGLIGFTAIAGLLTVYTAADMLMYNSKRKREFNEAQRSMAADSLEAARLAYMTGKATPEQIALVDEAREHESEGGSSIFAKLPPLVGAPAPVRTDAQAAATEGDVAAAAAAAAEAIPDGAAAAEGAPKKKSWWNPF